jgi:hypothetical protein
MNPTTVSNSTTKGLFHFRATPQANPLWRISGLLELEECGFTLADFSRVVGRDVYQYTELKPCEQLLILRKLAGKHWYGEFSNDCQGYARAKILLHSPVIITEDTKTRENASQDT